MARLSNAVETAGIPVATDARATGLFVDGTVVHGVEATGGDGGREMNGCDALMLTCCGYGGNKSLVAKYIPEMAEALYLGHPGNRGDALLWGGQLGAVTADLPGYQGATPHGILISWALMMQGGIQVNARGERFANEHLGYSEQAVPVLAQPGGVAWRIYDQRIHETGLQFDDYRQAVAAGAIRCGNDVGTLCALTKQPFDAVSSTLSDVSGYRLGARDDSFGRSFAGGRNFEPPYFAVKVNGAMFHTQGGLPIDASARVLGTDGRPLPNLFAGGGAACGVSGPYAGGYLSGNGLLTAVIFGVLAGENAAGIMTSRTGES